MITSDAGIKNGDEIQKLGSAGMITAVVLVTAAMIWVATIGLNDPLLARERMSGQLWELDAATLMMTLGWYALIMGAAALRRSIKGAGSGWATMGFYFLIAAAGTWTVGMSLDISTSALIANWLSAPPAQQAAAQNLLNTLFPPGLGFGRGLFPLEILTNWLAFTFLGTGMLRSQAYPRRLAWPGLILGIIGMLFGIVMTYTGREAVFLPFTFLAFATLIWLLACGIQMARMAWQRASGAG